MRYKTHSDTSGKIYKIRHTKLGEILTDRSGDQIEICCVDRKNSRIQ